MTAPTYDKTLRRKSGTRTMDDDRAVDLMTRDLAEHVCRRVIKRTAPGLEVRQALEPKNNGVAPALQSIWRIWDVHREEWLAVYVDPDTVPFR